MYMIVEFYNKLAGRGILRGITGESVVVRLYPTELIRRQVFPSVNDSCIFPLKRKSDIIIHAESEDQSGVAGNGEMEGTVGAGIRRRAGRCPAASACRDTVDRRPWDRCLIRPNSGYSPSNPTFGSCQLTDLLPERGSGGELWLFAHRGFTRKLRDVGSG